MRPQSIVMFERLFLLSLALSAVSFLVNYDAMVAALQSEAALRDLGLGSGFALGLFAFGLAVYLLLWFFIARKASNIAKWVYVVLLALSIPSLVSSLSTFSFSMGGLLGIAVYALEVAAAVFLFRADAIAWLKGQPSAGPATFD
jgi:hypothetical protein